MFFRRKPSFPRERLTVRILADVDDVDQQDEEIMEPTHDARPAIQLVEQWFLPGITVQLCWDDGDGCLQWLTDKDVASWGRSRSELFSTAIDNLNAAKVPSANLRRLKADGGEVYSPICGGVALSSLILADRLLSDFNFVKENVAAVIPNRDTYYFCDKSSPENLELLKFVRDIAWDDEDCPREYRISKSILVADKQAASGWAPLQQPL